MDVVEHSEKDYTLITTAMDSKMVGRLDSPLHMAAYMLNPYYSYANPSIFADLEVVSGFYQVAETFYHDDGQAQNLVMNIEKNKFKKKEGLFVKVAAIRAIDNAEFNAGKLVLKENLCMLHL